MWDVKACRCCLTTAGKLERISDVYKRIYAVITGLEISGGDGYPTYLCVECNMQIKKTLAFRRKCRRAFFVLKEIMTVRNQVTLSDVMTVDRQKTNLDSQLTTDTRIVTDIKPDNYEELDRLLLEEQRILEEEKALEEIRQEEMHQNDQEDTFKDDDIDTNDIDLDDVFKDLKEDEIQEEIEEKKEKPTKKTAKRTTTKIDREMKRQSILEKEKIKLTSRALAHCTIKVLTKEEQVLAFKQRMQNEPFRSAMFKCGVCLTVYRDMPQLLQHVLKHNDNSTSEHICPICRVRVASAEELRKHRAVFHTYEFTCGDCSASHYTIASLNACYTRHGGAPLPVRASTDGGLFSKVFLRYFTVKPLPHHLMYQTLASRSGVQRHVCSECKIGYLKRTDLLTHTEKHVKASKENGFMYNCDICGLAAKHLGQMRRHMGTWHLYSYTCTRCEAVCMNRVQANDHCAKHNRNEIPTASEEKSFSCEFCAKSYSNYEAYKKHRIWKHTTKRYKSHCNVCGFSFTSCYDLYRHQLAEHQYLSVLDPTLGDPRYRCAPCKVQFVDQLAYHTHLIWMAHKESFKIKLACRNHKLLFKTDEEMAAHDAVCVYKMKNEQKYPKLCNFCDVVLNSAMEWRRHEKFTHSDMMSEPTGVTARKRLCELCGKTVNRYSIRKHMCYRKKHASAHECRHCQQVLWTAEEHVLHTLRAHTHKPYHCAVCAAHFEYRYECKDHILKIHAPEMPFQCEFCPRQFSHVDFVVQHARKAHDADLRAEQRRKVRGRLPLFKHKLFVYPLMKLDASFVDADVLQRAKLEICDYTDENFKVVPLEDYSKYIILDNQQTPIERERKPLKRKQESSDVVPQKRIKQEVTDDRNFLIKPKKEKEEEELSEKEKEEVKPSPVTKARKKKPVDKNKYECSFCQVTLPSAKNYVVHMVYNHTRRPYRCALCPAKYKYKFECRDHILKIHAPETPFQCKYCDQRFAHPEVLNAHSTGTHGLAQKERARRDVWSPMRGKLYVYPHMKIDMRWISHDILEKVDLEICDYLDENNTVLEDYRPYVMFSNDAPIESRKREKMTSEKNIIKTQQGKSMVSLDTDEETDANGEENLFDEHLKVGTKGIVAKVEENVEDEDYSFEEHEMDDENGSGKHEIDETVDGNVEDEENVEDEGNVEHEVITFDDDGVLMDECEEITLERDSKQVVNVDGVDYELLVRNGEQFVMIADVLYKIETE